MGKPYQQELNSLAGSYASVMGVDIDAFATAVSACAQRPLVTVGSGGSLSVAELTSFLHQFFTNHISKATTPLDILSFGRKHFGASFFLFSAGGKNKDILRAFTHLVALEPPRLTVLTARRSTPLAKQAERYHFADSIEIPLPCGKDGFLATNSLLAFAMIAIRAYDKVFKSEKQLPEKLEKLLHPGVTFDEYTCKLEQDCSPLWEREHLIVLHSPGLLSAAKDIESRFTEAALGTVQIADFRHFAHGRHHWLAKRGSSSSVLALVSDEDALLAEKTLNLLPSSIPTAKLNFGPESPHNLLKALCTSIVIAGLVGRARQTDPGRPGVPQFGRKIYNLGPLVVTRKQTKAIEVAVERKLSVVPSHAISSSLSTWNDHFHSFTRDLKKQTFHGIVLDYDGTICDDRNRFNGPNTKLVATIITLLNRNVPFGIATGRGESACQDLRKSIPVDLWSKVVVGYHNGSQISLLSQDFHQIQNPQKSPQLEVFIEALRINSYLNDIAKWSLATYQVSIRPLPGVQIGYVWNLLQEVSNRVTNGQVRLVCSSHSIDALAPRVSKLSVVSQLRSTFNLERNAPILCIGDRGRWPGNDYELLTEAYSLSVDEVSSSIDTCWNIAPPGHRGSQALSAYLSGMRIKKRTFQLSPDKISGGTT